MSKSKSFNDVASSGDRILDDQPPNAHGPPPHEADDDPIPPLERVPVEDDPAPPEGDDEAMCFFESSVAWNAIP